MLPEGGLTFLGDALLLQLAPNSEELLVYGLDGNIDVAVQEEAKDGRTGHGSRGACWRSPGWSRSGSPMP